MNTIRSLGENSGSKADNSDLVSTLTDKADFFIFSYSPSAKTLVSWSDNSEKILGAKDVSIARDGNLFLRHAHPDDRFVLLGELEKALRGESSYRCTYRWIRPDNNEIRWMHCRAALTKRGGEELLEGIILDLSGEFTGSTGKLAGLDSVNTILAAFPIMVFTLDKDLRIARMNRPAESSVFSFGDSDFKANNFRIGRPLLDCFADESQRSHYEYILQQIISGKMPYHRTRVFQGNSVQSLEMTPLSEQDIVEGILCTVSDISETVRLERQLAELQKVDGLKLLAAGVAHHFNNALQSIVGQATAIHSHPQNLNLVQEASQSIMDVVNKSSELSRQLFVFGENSGSILQEVDINTAVMAATSHIDDLLSSGFKVGVVFGNVSRVKAKQTELVEAIEAVIRNARDSMLSDTNRSDKGRNLSVKTYETTLKDLEVADLKAGRYARIAISDSGKGMAEKEKRRCFDPFFTTKETDQRSGINLGGAGLGLSKTYSIIRAFGGAITAESKAGHGSLFSIYLPLALSENSDTQQTPLLSAEAPAPQILVIDDDSLVLGTVSSMLQDMGFGCLTADNYSKAISLAKSFSSSIKVVLLDAIMPGTDGVTVLKKLKKMNPALKVIGFSGAAPNETQPMLEAGAEQILMKPVAPKTLTEVIRSILDVDKDRAA